MIREARLTGGGVFVASPQLGCHRFPLVARLGIRPALAPVFAHPLLRTPLVRGSNGLTTGISPVARLRAFRDPARLATRPLQYSSLAVASATPFSARTGSRPVSATSTVGSTTLVDAMGEDAESKGSVALEDASSTRRTAGSLPDQVVDAAFARVDAMKSKHLVPSVLVPLPGKEGLDTKSDAAITVHPEDEDAGHAITAHSVGTALSSLSFGGETETDRSGSYEASSQVSSEGSAPDVQASAQYLGGDEDVSSPIPLSSVVRSDSVESGIPVYRPSMERSSLTSSDEPSSPDGLLLARAATSSVASEESDWPATHPRTAYGHQADPISDQLDDILFHPGRFDGASALPSAKLLANNLDIGASFAAFLGHHLIVWLNARNEFRINPGVCQKTWKLLSARLFPLIRRLGMSGSTCLAAIGVVSQLPFWGGGPAPLLLGDYAGVDAVSVVDVVFKCFWLAVSLVEETKRINWLFILGMHEHQSEFLRVLQDAARDCMRGPIDATRHIAVLRDDLFSGPAGSYHSPLDGTSRVHMLFLLEQCLGELHDNAGLQAHFSPHRARTAELFAEDDEIIGRPRRVTGLGHDCTIRRPV